MRTELEILLLDLLDEIDREIEERKHSGNDEDYSALEELSDRGHAMRRKLHQERLKGNPT